MVEQMSIWVLRALWISMPFSVGPALTDTLSQYSDSLRVTALVIAWISWGLGMLATLVPHTVSLTYLRTVAPLATAAALWALSGDASTLSKLLGLGVAGLAAVIAFSAPVGAWFINGTAYGDERRLPLRPPARFLVLVPFAWALTVAGVIAGPLLIASGRLISGIVVLIVGLPLAAAAARGLFGLGQRWLVFVPAGIVVHDFTALADPQLFRRGDIDRMGPALADTGATDLTLAAPGLALELSFHEIATIVRRPADRESSPVPEPARAVLVTPSQPGVVLKEAERRHIPVG